MFRNLGQKIFEVSERIQVISLGGLCYAVDDRTGICTIDGVDHDPVLFPYTERTDCSFCSIVIHRNRTILQEIPQVGFLMQAVRKANAGFGLW